MAFEISQSIKLAISIHSRLHITLLAMHSGKYRINGGIGFAIDRPECVITFTVGPVWTIEDSRDDPLSVVESERLLMVLREEQVRCGFGSALAISIGGEMRTHYGFGSGTAIRLACLEALHRLNGCLPVSHELVAASGRGGTSGIGIHTYFSGGYVFDLGRPAKSEFHAPSHQIPVSCSPLVFDQLPMPEWEIGVCIPLDILHKTEAEERAFFERTCPLPAEDVYITVYHAVFGICAAIREADRAAFCHALKAIQDCAWKKAERLEYGGGLEAIEQALYVCGAEAVGMSSLGPSLFFLADDVSDVVRRMNLSGNRVDCFVSRPVNHGRILSDV
jgi:beta-ribofuranosylaminobenzene 5'-phosphate synthase